MAPGPGPYSGISPSASVDFSVPVDAVVPEAPGPGAERLRQGGPPRGPSRAHRQWPHTEGAKFNLIASPAGPPGGKHFYGSIATQDSTRPREPASGLRL